MQECVAVIGAGEIRRGYGSVVRQGALLVRLGISPPPVAGPSLAAVEARMRSLIGSEEPLVPAGDRPLVTLAQWIAAWIDRVQRSADMPTFADGAVVSAVSGGPAVFTIAIPSLERSFAATGTVVDWVVRAVNRLVSCQRTDDLEARLPKVVEALRRTGPAGVNTLRLLRAAHDLGIPWRRVSGNVFQFGQGAAARWLDSSFTDATPRISSALARDKTAAAAVLRDAGLPVPQHTVVRDAEEAAAVAGRLGYPVVVKPANLDGGRGVAAGLLDPGSVRKAYAAARRLSTRVLVEKHVDGRDYRLQVFQGEVYWAVERIPGGVTGDGALGVRQLLARLNADPHRGRGVSFVLRPIDLDDEALDLLAEQGLHPDAVPEQGRFVRLRRSANVANGGLPVPVLDSVHPDNVALAARAARALRLDVAGIDLLMPDIARSWLTAGGAICEVNAQPQLAAHLPAWLLQRLVRDQGRIPIVFVLGGSQGEPWLDEIREVLVGAGRCLGVATPRGVWIGGKQALVGPCDAFRGGLALVADPLVEAAMVVVGDGSLLRTGLPVDRFDVLVLADSAARDPDDAAYRAWESLVLMLSAMCSTVLVDQDCANCVGMSARIPGARVRAVSRDGLARAVAEELAEAES